MAFELTKKIEKHLVNDGIAWLTTVTPSGRPAPRSVWFLWDGSAITVYSQPNVAKLKHIAANDQVSLHFNSTPDGGDVVRQRPDLLEFCEVKSSGVRGNRGSRGGPHRRPPAAVVLPLRLL